MWRFVVWVHRWLSVLLCLFIATWFVSGAVLMYVPFPSLSSSERMDGAGEINASLIRLSPADAVSAAFRISHPLSITRSQFQSTLDQLRLIARNGRPLYVIRVRGEAALAVWADTGDLAQLQSAEEAREIALQFAGLANQSAGGGVSEIANDTNGELFVGSIDGPVEYDQWIVYQGFDSQRPYYRVHLNDVDATVLYVSQATGEVAQRTTRSQRGWNYVGAVLHWLYPTVLRKHAALWNSLVWWLSLAGTLLVLLGTVLGIRHLVLAVRASGGKLSLYRGWMKWHHLLGLCTFIFVFTWMLSGWLSMDKGSLFSKAGPTAEQLDRFRGIQIEDAANQVSIDDLQSLGLFREVAIKSIASRPVMLVRSRNEQRIYAIESGQLVHWPLIPDTLIQQAVAAAWNEFSVLSLDPVTSDDVYVAVRQNGLPLTSVRARLDDTQQTWVHVDAASADIVSVMDQSRRAHRWLYHGLHSLDFPGLINRRPLWDIVMLTLLGAGFVFSITGVVTGYRRIRKLIRN